MARVGISGKGWLTVDGGPVGKVFACAKRECDCREITIEGVGRRGAPIALKVDVDTGEAEVAGEIYDKAGTAAFLARLRDALDGDALDLLARGMLAAKGQRVDEATARRVTLERPRLVAYDEVFAVVRGDEYVIDGERYAAVDMHCPNPRCPCDEVGVQFVAVSSEDDDGFVGTVRALAGEVELEPADARAPLLRDLWGRFQRRYPRWRERLGERTRRIQAANVGPRVAPAPAAGARVVANIGRNDPCPCGSGKKFKKCCLGRGRS